MKKRIIASLLLCSLLLTVPALAAPAGGGFTRIRTYTGQFADLAADSVFYNNVSALYEYGLSVGKPDGTFGLTDSLTVGQAVIFAGRIRSLYRTGDAEAGPAAYGGDGGPAALPYLRYLQAEGVLDTALDDALDVPATRAQMAHVLAGILPEEALPSVHSDLVTEYYAAHRAITDVTEYTPYYQDILALYRKGISAGSDAAGSFLPDARITRGAAAAMLTRIVDPSLRVTPQWEPATASGVRDITLAGLVRPGAYLPSPTTGAELDESIRYMLCGGGNQLTLRYDAGLSAVQARKLMQNALEILKTYCEQSYNSVTCSFTPQGSITLTFSANQMSTPEILAYRESTLAAAVAVRDRLWEDGLLRPDMTETEKARVYYTWICENCAYDFSAGDYSLSHIPYNLFENGAAVCDGYTGAYNLFLKLEGIRCMAISNEQHIWTVAELDGALVHIDTTWGDSGQQPNYYYFAMTPEQSRRVHPW